MASNVMQEYIKMTQDEVISYIKLIFERSYSKKIALRYMNAYLNVRFYNFYPKDDNLTFRKNYLNAIKEEEANIVRAMPEKKKLIENMGLFFYYILYFDKISYRVDIDEIIEKLYKIRKKLLRKDNEDFKENFRNTYEEYADKKEKFLKKFETEEFYLKVTDYEGANNANRVNLKYNIKFPMLYSTQAIENVFNSGLVAEDKLFVEYNLMSVEIIQDILKGNFKRQYIIEFNTNLFKKKRKLASLLNVINNSAVQDKVNLKITYKEFLQNKDNIYELMRDGFKFAVILDNSFEPEYANFERLNAFYYTIASKKLDYYDKVITNESIIKRLIKI
ncbi:MAG: hypothetical protein ACI4VC_03680 [Clostridia bacterium]